jgi:hypothetical protein
LEPETKQKKTNLGFFIETWKVHQKNKEMDKAIKVSDLVITFGKLYAIKATIFVKKGVRWIPSEHFSPHFLSFIS